MNAPMSTNDPFRVITSWRAQIYIHTYVCVCVSECVHGLCFSIKLNYILHFALQRVFLFNSKLSTYFWTYLF